MHAPFFLMLATFARASALNFARLGLVEPALSRTSVEHPGMLALDALRLRMSLPSAGERMSTALVGGVVSESD